MSKKYKVFWHSLCGKLIELEVTEKEYIGYCKTCKRKVKIKK